MATINWKSQTELDQEYYDQQCADGRARRNDLLAQTDYRVLQAAERGETPPKRLVEYRQALRDWPDHPEFPHNDPPEEP